MKPLRGTDIMMVVRGDTVRALSDCMIQTVCCHGLLKYK